MQPLQTGSGLIYRTNELTMKKLTAILFLVTAAAISAFGQNTETRSLDNFSAISVGEAIKLVLIPGNKNEARITATNVDLDEIETRVGIRIENRGRGRPSKIEK